MKHWPHDSSRCPECGVKQGDILPDIQPCTLSAQLAEITEELAKHQTLPDSIPLHIRLRMLIDRTSALAAQQETN